MYKCIYTYGYVSADNVDVSLSVYRYAVRVCVCVDNVRLFPVKRLTASAVSRWCEEMCSLASCTSRSNNDISS